MYDGDIAPHLVAGLKKESYRGYDSSGVAVIGQKAACFKAVGDLDQLEKKIDGKKLSGSVGIGHNRWATHGSVTEANAHPHTDCRQEIFIAHNGIIENFSDLRAKLIEQGHVFTSDTDSEVLVHLIEMFYAGSLEDAVRQALHVIRGTYGLVAVSIHEPETLVAARLSSPLVLATSSQGTFVASDPAALRPYSRELIFLDDGEVATITQDTYNVTDLANRVQFKTPATIDWEETDTNRGAYSHFMLKEIHEQGASLTNTMRGRLTASGAVRLGGLDQIADRMPDIGRLQIIGCGTAYYAGLYGSYLLEEYAHIPARADIASEFRYRTAPTFSDTATLVISQSGETADTLAALREVRQRGELTFGIVNAVGSSIARDIDAGLYNHIGPEIGVASTKAFTSQLAMLVLLSIYLGRTHGLEAKTRRKLVEELAQLPELITAALAQQTILARRVAESLRHTNSVLFVGRKYSYPIAMEGALKLKEVAYIHAEGYSAGELKHGAIALIDQQTPTIAVCPRDSVYEKTLSNLQEIKSRSGPIIAIATEGDEDIRSVADEVIYTPKTHEALSGIVTVLPLQLLAYYAGLARGCNVDKPRNLAKSVTVE